MFNKLVVACLPLVPRPVIRKISRRYIAGDRLEDAILTAQQLHREDGAKATIDVLGEFVETREQALKDKADSSEVLRAIVAGGLVHRAGLSIKPTSLGLGIDRDFAYANIRELALQAREHGIFMRIDMENTPYTDLTLGVYRQLREEGIDNVGVVLQAMLRRTERDVRELLEYRPSVRLCKGIYRESREVAWQGREEVRASYRKLLRLIVENGLYAAIATHDDPLIADAYDVVKAHGLTPDQYEFQMLLGVKERTRSEILAAGHRLRVYVPFGEDWYGYSSRRLKENPAMAGMIARAVLLGQ
ncbi:MAG: proline dehydrogenase family protein [Candidatus Krumholzibacteriia bacterium]